MEKRKYRIDEQTEKLRRERISETMKERFRKNPEEFKRITETSRKKKEQFGYVNSPEAKKKVSASIIRMWKEGRATEKQKKTLFITGEDSRRMDTQFKDGHEVPLKTRLAVKESRKHQIFPMKDSSIEVKMQNLLKELGIEFLTHQYMNEIEHGYQCDILVPSKKLIIECFGNYWHNYPYAKEVDIQRCNELRAKGWKVFVFWENEIKAMQIDDLKLVLEKLN